MKPGHQLPFLLAGSFRRLIDELHRELATRGHPDVRPAHGFALQALTGGGSVSDLGRRLGVSKQAAGRTAARLQELGYVATRPDPDDGRATRLRLTKRGEECLRLSGEILNDLQDRLVSPGRVDALHKDLARLAGNQTVGDLPGWLQNG